MKLVCLAMLMLGGAVLPAHAQTTVQQYASDFSKLKDHTKSKHGVTVHKYAEVISEPWLARPQQYAGHYESDEYQMDVRVGTDGAVRAAGRDPEMFELRDARIRDGILRGQKHYAGGRSEPFEAAFLIRRARSNPRAAFTAERGLGFKLDLPDTGVTDSWQRVFMARQPRD